jgi:hypothetical protein
MYLESGDLNDVGETARNRIRKTYFEGGSSAPVMTIGTFGALDPGVSTVHG